MPEPEITIAIGGALLIVAVLASRVASRFGVPVLLLFLTVGMVAGSDGLGGIHFSDPHAAQLIGIVALVLILFSGGLSTRWSDVKSVARPAAALSTAGVAITAVVVGSSASWLLELPWQSGLLVGAIVSSTDAAAVFTVLRGGGLKPAVPLGHVLELESGGNDPMAAFLTLAFIDLQLQPDYPVALLIMRFVLQVIVGGFGGFAAGRVASWAIKRARLDFEGLYPVITIAAALMAFAIATILGGSGFLAAYLAGITLASSEFAHRKTLERFHDAVA